MATAVVGSTPISFTNSKGTQGVVPLSAFQFGDSGIQLDPTWEKKLFDAKILLEANDEQTLVALAKARAAVGELKPQPVPPRAPALALKAKHPGPESNGIVVTVSVKADDSGSPPKIMPVLSRQITLTVKETDTYADLATGDAAAKAIGVDPPSGNPGDPPAGTGLVVVKQGSTAGSKNPAVATKGGVMAPKIPVDLKDADGKVVLTLLPRSDYTGTGGLSYEVTSDGKTFTVTATYDSAKEEDGTQAPVTLQSLNKLAAPVAYLVTVSAPPAGAALPADGCFHLSGGGAGRAASCLLYTS